MQEAIAPSLKAWESFYVIVGSAGAALTGLQFEIIALIAESRRRSSSASIAAFGTPTIVHFCTVLLVGSVLSAPFRTLSGPPSFSLATPCTEGNMAMKTCDWRVSSATPPVISCVACPPDNSARKTATSP